MREEERKKKNHPGQGQNPWENRTGWYKSNHPQRAGFNLPGTQALPLQLTQHSCCAALGNGLSPGSLHPLHSWAV